MHNLSCLLAKVLQSIYFEVGEFLEADLSTRPSFAWRSILYGRELMVKGLVKRVGNGKSILVWNDEWIKDNGNRRPLMKNSITDILLTVDKLIDVSSRGWDLNKLEELFFIPMTFRALSNKKRWYQKRIIGYGNHKRVRIIQSDLDTKLPIKRRTKSCYKRLKLSLHLMG